MVGGGFFSSFPFCFVPFPAALNAARSTHRSLAEKTAKVADLRAKVKELRKSNETLLEVSVRCLWWFMFVASWGISGVCVGIACGANHADSPHACCSKQENGEAVDAKADLSHALAKAKRENATLQVRFVCARARARAFALSLCAHHVPPCLMCFLLLLVVPPYRLPAGTAASRGSSGFGVGRRTGCSRRLESSTLLCAHRRRCFAPGSPTQQPTFDSPTGIFVSSG